VAYPADLYTREQKEKALGGAPESGSHVLRSAKEVTGYHIEALDGEVGHVEEFIMDDELWTLRYMVVDTQNWLPGRKVLVSPTWVKSLDWAEQKVTVELTCDAVKDSPKYDPRLPINRDYEERLYDFYGRPVYWA
jgi:hypothetical protein